VCRNVLSLSLQASGDGTIPQLLLTRLSSEGARRLAGGETPAELPPRCVLHAARPVPVR
jgi:hypothetical protein